MAQDTKAGEIALLNALEVFDRTRPWKESRAYMGAVERCKGQSSWRRVPPGRGIPFPNQIRWAEMECLWLPCSSLSSSQVSRLIAYLSGPPSSVTGLLVIQSVKKAKASISPIIAHLSLNICFPSALVSKLPKTDILYVRLRDATEGTL